MNDLNNYRKYEIKYSLRNLILKIVWYSVFVCLGIYFLTLIKFDVKNYDKIDFLGLAISFLFIISFGRKIIQELRNKNNKIILSNQGIEIKGVVYNWNSISIPIIISKKKYTSKYSIEYEEHYLSFNSGAENIEIIIDDYNTNKENLTSILETFRNDKKSQNVKSVFDKIPNFEEYLELEDGEASKKIKETLTIIKNNKVELIKFCKTKTNSETNKIELIYYSLSENYIEWEDFLTSEFLRIFELAINENSFDKLLPLLENIIPDGNNTKYTEKVVHYLSTKLNSTNSKIKFQALEFINLWIDEDSITEYPEIIRQIKSLTKDNNWKIRWNANRILKENNIEFENNLLDNIKAKFQNPYKV